MHTVRFVHIGDDCPEVETTIQVEDGTTLLQAADTAEVPFRRGCNFGNCRLCKAHVREGIENILNRKTGSEFSDSERVVTCVATVHGDVEVEVQPPKKPLS